MVRRVVLVVCAALLFCGAPSCGGNGPPLDAGCPVCHEPDANFD